MKKVVLKFRWKSEAPKIERQATFKTLHDLRLHLLAVGSLIDPISVTCYYENGVKIKLEIGE